MTQKLQGLMQDDFPLTLNHIRRRLGSCNQGAEVVSLTEEMLERGVVLKCAVIP